MNTKIVHKYCYCSRVECEKKIKYNVYEEMKLNNER